MPKPGILVTLVVVAAGVHLSCLAMATAMAGTASSSAFAQTPTFRDSAPAMPQHTAKNAPVDEVEMKPDLDATNFSPQNAYFFARLSKMAYRAHHEVHGLLAGNSTSTGLGFDHFHWFETGEEANKEYFDEIHDTEAFVAANDHMMVVVFRGTKEMADWATNLRVTRRGCPSQWNLPGPGGNMHEGFDDGVDSVWQSAGMHSTIKSLYYEYGKRRKLYLAGHSLGGALATIAAARLALGENMDIAGIYTIGSPRVFDAVSAKHFDAKINHGVALKDKYFRSRNNNDIVPRVPASPFIHVGTEIYLDRLGTISATGVVDRLLGRLSAYLRGEFIEDINDHATSEYVRLFEQLVINSRVPLLEKAVSVVVDALESVVEKSLRAGRACHSRLESYLPRCDRGTYGCVEAMHTIVPSIVYPTPLGLAYLSGIDYP